MVEPPAPGTWLTAAEQIWRAGVRAVDARQLVRQAVSHDHRRLLVAGHDVTPKGRGRLLVVGGGKAGAAMAEGLESELAQGGWLEQVTGWVNVPADCVRSLRRIHLHAARPAGANEPTVEGAFGTSAILNLVAQARPEDVVIVLLSGGGSALLPAPVVGVSLEEKLQVTRVLARSGAPIDELNAVRRSLSQIKGGGLLRTSRSDRMIALIISDVIGDPLEVIASGPTTPSPTTEYDALCILRKWVPDRTLVSEAVWRALETPVKPPAWQATAAVDHMIIGSIDVAMKGAAAEAEQLGFEVRRGAELFQGEAAAWGATLYEHVTRERAGITRPTCWLFGGETTVNVGLGGGTGLGGRNQEAGLGMIRASKQQDWQQMAAVLAGTDGEDGPTDAAGALLDDEIVNRALTKTASLEQCLSMHHSYPFLETVGGLLKTGPTHTNVMDLHVVVAGPATGRPI